MTTSDVSDILRRLSRQDDALRDIARDQSNGFRDLGERIATLEEARANAQRKAEHADDDARERRSLRHQARLTTVAAVAAVVGGLLGELGHVANWW